jgi:MoaA/NifB/PqqE/SkfB family radical SAM enzyme
LGLSAADRSALLRFLEEGRSTWTYHTQTLIRYLRTGRVEKPCSCGFNYLFVRSNGDVSLCPLFEKPVGNVVTASLAALLASAEARSARLQVGRAAECSRCTEGFAYLRTLFTLGPRSFLDLHRHLGLQKYLQP